MEKTKFVNYYAYLPGNEKPNLHLSNGLAGLTRSTIDYRENTIVFSFEDLCFEKITYEMIFP